MKQNDILILLIPACVIVFVWIAFSVYHSFITSTIPETIHMQITPLKPNFDSQIVEELKRRKKVSPIFDAQQLESTQSSVASVPVIKHPTPTKSPLPTPSIRLESIPSATGEGGLVP